MPIASMLQPVAEEGDPAPSYTASSRSIKRARGAVAAAAAGASGMSVGGPTRPTPLQRHLHTMAAAAAAELMAQSGGKTTSNVGSSLLVDRTDSSEPQHSTDAEAEATASREGHRSDAPPPSWGAVPSQQASHAAAAVTAAAAAAAAATLAAVTAVAAATSSGGVSVEEPAAKRQRVVREGPPPPLSEEDLHVEDRESPAPRDDDEDGHYVFEIGENFSKRFKIMRKFGEGTFGRVVECWDRKRRDYVAVKIIRNIQKYRDAAMVELEILRSLEAADPSQAQGHCVRLLEWFDYRGHVCMVFERLGLSLYDFMRRNAYKPFPLDLARSFTRQLLESVAFMHRLHLVHTDLKPENILLRSHDCVKANLPPGSKLCKRLPASPDVVVIDFGSATWEREYHCAVVSTRHYRAPEVILGLGWSYPADLWSVGCILTELVTGDALFQTHENLEHLAMMEVVLGAIPTRMAAAADENAAGYFRNNHLDWPGGAESKKSVRAVAKLRRLRDYLRLHGDESLRPHMDLLVDLLTRLLEYEPSTRITAEQALRHPFFIEAPQPQSPPLQLQRQQQQQQQQQQYE